MNRITLILLPLTMISAPVAAQTAALQNLDALERRLVIALGADIGAPGGPTAPIDRRLKLAACPSAVLIDPPAMGAASLRCAEIGWRIRVSLAKGGNVLPVAGRGMPAAAVARAAPVVRRGDPVDLVAGDPGFSVTTPVTAEQDGAPGDRIRVRGDRAKPPILAEVVDAGTVRLPGFK